jgi:hypothetical protein
MLCNMPSKLGRPQATDSSEAVLNLLYKYMAIPSRHAVRSTVNPQAPDDAETALTLLISKMQMQASWVCTEVSRDSLRVTQEAHSLLCDYLNTVQ